MPFILSQTDSIANHYIAEMRNVEVQQDRMRFRRNLERLGELFAYEISKHLPYEDVEIETPLGIAECALLAEQPVLMTIIRAGLPLHQGLLNVFDQADCGFIGAYRKTKKSGEFEIKKEYMTSPDLNDRIVIMADPMLATGRSIVLTCKELLGEYALKELHIVSAIASEEGIAHVKAYLPRAKLWIGAIDSELTSKSYIVPGLGDAGDLAYGSKLSN
ncbi:uracil phosphoribosyltransferase [Olivibacter sitiensis]|uniref:uracil phosphoribosyltransferase n=1 Tax=Olivibacter sitiensis TaxID=376470 RepID=UPI00041C1F16|nr:uracil phosphoribosyltransferase [Olivibacter sitiensis]